MDSSLVLQSLLQDIYDVGNRMIATLEAEDIDAFSELVRERGMLLQQLTTRSDRNAQSEERALLSAQFGEQFEALERAMTQLEARLEHGMSTIGRYKDAKRSYTGANAHAGILHANLRG